MCPQLPVLKPLDDSTGANPLPAEQPEPQTHEETLVTFFRRSPLVDTPIDLTRDPYPLDDDSPF